MLNSNFAKPIAVAAFGRLRPAAGGRRRARRFWGVVGQALRQASPATANVAAARTAVVNHAIRLEARRWRDS